MEGIPASLHLAAENTVVGVVHSNPVDTPLFDQMDERRQDVRS